LTAMAEIASLKATARRMREDILLQIHAAGSGHPGGSMSCVELLAVLFGHVIKPSSDWIRRNSRDHVVLSKGHAAPALYAVLAESGLIAREELETLRRLGSRLQGHPDRTRLPEVEMSTGSLGQGLSVGLGLALAMARRDEPHRSYVILGDGEMNSGQVWEAILFAGAHKVDRLVALLDANGIQNDGPIEEILDIKPYAPKLEACGWAVTEIDGQDVGAVAGALDWASSDEPGAKPRMVVANTRKGAGVSFMTDRVEWHSHALTDEQYEAALLEVQG
jgi:transketolase